MSEEVSELLTTVFLVLALVPTNVLQGNEDLSWIGHSSPAGPPSVLLLLRDWFTAVLETAPHCNNSRTTINSGSVSVCQRRMGSVGWPGEKKTRG